MKTSTAAARLAAALLGVLAAALLAAPAGAQYPSAAGEAVTLLPDGSLPITYRGSRYFVSADTWYQQVVAGYVVVTPPAGIVVPTLPPAYSTVWLAGVPYYKANNVYYAAAPGGYAVVPSPASQGVYYCVSTRRYFPNASDCAEGWSVVPTVPPQLRN